MNIWTLLTKSVLNVSVWRISKWTMKSVLVIFDRDFREPGSDLMAIFKIHPVGVDGPLLEEMRMEASGALILLNHYLISSSLLMVVNGKIDGEGFPLVPLLESLYRCASSRVVCGGSLLIRH